MAKINLYCYVDEIVQDTEEKFFLVAKVLTESSVKERTERKLEAIETRTKKRETKWSKISYSMRKLYRGYHPDSFVDTQAHQDRLSGLSN